MTDGSFKIKGAAGYCVGADFDTLWQGACRVPGNHDCQCSYRTELVGILATCCLIDKVCKDHDISTGTVTLACDNESAGYKSLIRSSVKPSDDHFDVISAIQ